MVHQILHLKGYRIVSFLIRYPIIFDILDTEVIGRQWSMVR